MKRLSTIMWMSALLLACASAWAGTTVTFHADPQVSGGAVYLGDIAEIVSSEIGTADQLATVRVASSPLPGQQRRVDIDYIKVSIRQAGLNPDLVTFDPAMDVLIHGACTAIGGQELLDMAREIICKHLPYPPEIISISATNLPTNTVVPPGDLQIDITTQPNEDFVGYAFFSFNFSVDGRMVKRAVLHVQVSVITEVAVAVAPIARGQVLSAQDVIFEQRDLADVDASAVTSLDQIEGMTAKMGFRQGQTVLTRFLECPPAILRGDIVNLQSVAGCVSVVTPAVAKQDGGVGDRILVHSQTTDRDIQAVVIDNSTVRIIARPTMTYARSDAP